MVQLSSQKLSPSHHSGGSTIPLPQIACIVVVVVVVVVMMVVVVVLVELHPVAPHASQQLGHPEAHPACA
jgi:Ni/Fe-hydrogenase subunit HybB-like protein